MAQTSSRRAILTSLAAAPLAGAKLALASDDPADIAFRGWLEAVRAVNDPAFRDMPDEAIDPAMARLKQVEEAMREMAPSVMLAAAIAMVEMSYGIGREDTLAGLLHDAEARTYLRILACLRLFLTGTVDLMASDLLDDPERPYGDGLLDRTMRWEA